jgi:hypothetical protein
VNSRKRKRCINRSFFKRFHNPKFFWRSIEDKRWDETAPVGQEFRSPDFGGSQSKGQQCGTHVGWPGPLSSLSAWSEVIAVPSVGPSETRPRTADLVVYLDLDGVVQHESVMWHARRGIYMSPTEAAAGRTLFEWLPILEDALAPFPHVKLVLSSTWCIWPGYGNTLKRFPEELRQRFIGGTFHKRVHRADPRALADFKSLSRGQQVVNDVFRRRPKTWLALDDDSDRWPDWARGNLVECNGSTGLSSSAVQAELRAKLERCVSELRGETLWDRMQLPGGPDCQRRGLETNALTKFDYELLRHLEESPHFTPAGALAALQEALKKAGR